ncbi:GntR family transcriptional regulator [Anaerobacillus sp. MEB173]|uniref:GntR family transcriptional regulator n=1 Tax=Anaerobacillus sp. MEB173 TaxID=3383345 RepID=UPI003F90C4F7
MSKEHSFHTGAIFEGFQSNEFENITLSQKIAQAIAGQISEGILKQGDRLLENELTNFFGTSRAPIREALYILEKDGIVERIPRRGVFVKEYTKKELSDLYETVYRLQEIALRKVMDLVTPEQLKELDSLVEKMEEAVKRQDIKSYYIFLDELQSKYFTFSDNDVLRDIYFKLKKQLTPFRYISLSYPSSLEYSLSEYKEMLKGLNERNFTRILESLRLKENRALAILETYIKK